MNRRKLLTSLFVLPVVGTTLVDEEILAAQKFIDGLRSDWSFWCMIGPTKFSPKFDGMDRCLWRGLMKILETGSYKGHKVASYNLPDDYLKIYSNRY